MYALVERGKIQLYLVVIKKIVYDATQLTTHE